MKDFYKHLNINSYSSTEWKLMKISFSLLWILLFTVILFKYSYVTTPESIFKLFPEDFYLSPNTKITLFIANLILIYCYVFEKYIWLSLFGLSLTSLFAFSLEDSNSDFNRNTMITGIFFAQFLAYSIKKKYYEFDIEKYRVQFSVQIIAISYTLSGISKLRISGLNWICDGLFLPLQIMKTNYFSYVDDFNIKHINNAFYVINEFNNYFFIVIFILAFTLTIELFALFSVFSKKNAFIYGLLLMFMHIGIYIVLNVAIIGAFIPMFIFMVNPLYLLLVLCISIKKKNNFL
jgi:hypothetical protein